jgi:hypothetical protein
MGPEFFQTNMGRQFYDGTMPRVVTALERLANIIHAQQMVPRKITVTLETEFIVDDFRSTLRDFLYTNLEQPGMIEAEDIAVLLFMQPGETAQVGQVEVSRSIETPQTADQFIKAFRKWREEGQWYHQTITQLNASEIDYSEWDDIRIYQWMLEQQ